MAETIMSYALKHEKRTANPAAMAALIARGVPPLIAAALAKTNGS